MATSAGIRCDGRFRAALRALVPTLAALALCVAALPARAAFNNTSARGTFAGPHNYTITGGSLRAASNTTNACSLNSTSTATLSGIPEGSTITAAYLYWGGSGATGDWTVGFNAGGTLSSQTNISAAAGDRFTETYTTKSFFGGFYNVTSIVGGRAGGPNGTYTFGGLGVDSGGEYCSGQNVLSSWALVVVYSNPSERYRYTRVYDGLSLFRGSSVTTTQSGFRVPDLVDGKVSVVTWEGDPDTTTSFPLDGYTEELRFDGYPLSNSGCDATDNVYNSTIGTPTSCLSNSYGVDIDTFDVTPFLYEGQTGATLYYSSGNDAVFLSTQVISTTNTPVADIGIAKTHSGDFTAGQNGSFTIGVHNYGPEIATGTATVTDVLPAGLTFVSGTGTGWSCSAAGQTVTCANSAPSIAVGADLPALTLNVAVGGDAAGTLQNTASVSHPMFDGTGGNQTSTDTVTVLRSNLSTSTKTVVDVNGGDANPGDVLEYTITLTDTGTQGIAPTGVVVVDDLPANLGNLQIVSFAGATNQSAGTGGANGTGQVKVSGINLAAGGSATIVFRATISGSAGAGSVITNTATISNPSGPGASPSVNTTVTASQSAVSGNKVLYLYDNHQLTRTVQPSSNTTGVTVAAGSSQTWTLSQVLPGAAGISLPQQTVTATIRVSGSNPARSISAQLLNGAATIVAASNTCDVGNGTNTCSFSFSIPATTIGNGGTLGLRLTNNATKSGRDITVSQRAAAGYSSISFKSNTVVNVDSVKFYDAPYPGGAQKTTWKEGDTVYIRAVVSDPFGGYDVSKAYLLLKDANGATQLSKQGTPAANVMSNPTSYALPTNGSGTSLRIFEEAYIVPASPAYGNWVATVTGIEGVETDSVTGLPVSHSANGILTLQPDALSVVKAHVGDFIAGSNGVYTITVSNTGSGTVGGTTTVKDTLATGLTYVSATGGTDWACSAAGQVVTCTSNTSIPGNSSLTPITLTVAIAGNMGASVDNTASVGNSTIAGGFMTNGETVAATILHPNLSTSTKTVQDMDGGDADPGDVLRYTITLKESANVAASNISVVDAISGSLDGFTLDAGLTTCNGTDASTSTQLQRTGISLAANASCTIVFDVTVSAVAGAGLEINNTATITNPAGPGATPSAPVVVVSASQQAASGNKYLYVYANQTMSRVPHSATGTTQIAANGSLSFTLPAVAKQLAITPGSTIQVNLWLQRSGDTTNTTRSVYVQLFKNGSGQIGANSAPISFNSTALVRQQFTIAVPAFSGSSTLNPGDTLVLKVVDASTGANQSVGFAQWVDTGTDVPAKSSLVSLTTATVVNVDDVSAYAAAFPSTTTRASQSANDTVYFRATISDPFGGSDVGSATIRITDNYGVVRLTSAAMTAVATGTTTRTFEYAYTMPSDAAVGIWTASVTGNEGSEGMVSHTANFPFGVGVSRLTLAKTHTGIFVPGGTGSYSLVVHNNGLALTGTTTVTDNLPAGLTYVPAGSGGSGWSCSAASQLVTCATTATIAENGNLPTIVLNVSIAASPPSSVDNIAAVSHPSVNGGTPQPSNIDTAPIVSPDLSTSTKTVVEFGGTGDFDPGNTLRYTITLVESGGAAVTGASVADDLPPGVSGFAIVSLPAGAVDGSTVTGGANGTGHLAVSGINVAANGSATVVFDVVIGALAPGATIDNTATVVNPSGPGATPSAPTIIVSQSAVIASGNKTLYLHDNLTLDRTPQAHNTSTGVTVNSKGGTRDWVLWSAIPTGEQLVLSAGTIDIHLAVSTGGNTVTLQATLLDGTTTIGSSTSQTVSASSAVLHPFTITLNSDYTLAMGHKLTLRVVNTTNGNKNATVYEYNGAGSVVTFETSTVVNVDSVHVYSESHEDGNAEKAYYVHGDTVYVRAVVSDPFGASDVSAAELTLTDALGAQKLTAQSMEIVAGADTANARTFEWSFQVPEQAGIGNWTASVTAHEGSEGTVTHTGAGGFELRGAVRLEATWAGATAGDAVQLQVAGGSDAVAGSSTAPSGTTAPATAAATAAAAVTLSESFTTGAAGYYTIGLSCTKSADATAAAVTGTALSRQITMPTDSSVVCTFANVKTVPLTLVKLATVYSDPVNLRNNPKAIPGAQVTYTIIVTNPAPNPTDAGSVVVSDNPLPAGVHLVVSDFDDSGHSPVSFTDTVSASGLSWSFLGLDDDSDDVDFDDGSGAWAYHPQDSGDGTDPRVTGIRFRPGGAFNANGGQFQLQFRVKVD